MAKNLDGFLVNEQEPENKPTELSFRQYQTPPMKDFLKDLQGGKMMSQKELIEDIETLILLRENLQKEVFGDIEGIMVNMNNFLSSVGDKIDAIEQLKLRQKLIEVEEFKMQEKINAFRDIAQLKKELRDRVAEFKDRQNRINVIDDLIQ